MLTSHKICLLPNNRQRTYFARACGVARFAYNWALAAWQEQYKNGGKPNQFELRRQLNSIKADQFPWMLEVTKCAPQMAIIHLGEAFRRFFSKKGKYPQFKKKGVHDSFSLTNDQIKINGHKVKIPLLGWVKMAERIRFEGKILNATVSRQADRWFISFAIETESVPAPCENQAIVGVDLGILSVATLSNGRTIAGPKPHKTLLKRLRRVSRQLSRKVKRSANFKKAKMKLSRLHLRIANIRADATHKLTTELANSFQTIVIEDLNVRGMMVNRRLSRAIADMNFYEIRRQLTYKTEARKGKLIVADRFYASSKTCSCCGSKAEKLPLNIREWMCQVCGTNHDRDINAARNLASLAASSAV